METKCLILDGALGTELQKKGLPLGQRPEVFGYENPDLLKQIHESYIESGSDIIYANTFGLNRKKCKNLNYTFEELIRGNIKIAKEASLNRAKVALDIGPIGELMEPFGTLSFEEAYDIFKEIIQIGVQCEVDLIIF